MSRQQSTPEARSVRLLKVGEQVRHVLSELLARQQAHEELLSASTVSVTEVRMTPDLRQATVYVRPLLAVSMDVALRALRTNTAFFQREVARRLGLRFAAKLRFVPDESFDEASRIDALLADPRVQRDLEGSGED